MARKRFGFKPSHSDLLRRNDAAQRFYAATAGIDPPAELLNNVAPKRERAAPASSTEPMERDIQRAILEYLNHHPKIAFVGRFNSGAVQSSYNGHESYVRFHTIKGFPDIHGCLKGGRALYIEVKRPGKVATEDQADFLNKASFAGALAFVASSVEEVDGMLA